MTIATRWDVKAIRADFPILDQQVHGKPLAYLDNAATTHKPTAVIDAISEYYTRNNSNVHRGVHLLSQRATQMFDRARDRVRLFINASHADEIIFTKGNTEAINLVAESWGRTFLKPGDRILLTTMEHHSNIVPWQLIAERTGAEIIVAPIDDNGQLILDEFDRLLDERVKMVGIVHISNAIGTINPIEEIIERAHQVGAKVLVDGAQALAHKAVDVQALDVDFYTIAAHKVYGPTGLGALYGKRQLLEAMPPYQGGGGGIRSVTFEKTTYAALPDKFEPGTPNIADAIGFAAALDYLAPKLADAADHERRLMQLAEVQLRDIAPVRIVGNAHEKSGIISFVMDSAHPHDIGTILDLDGVAIRAGHHCCQPLMVRMGVPATARASFALYNTEADVEALVRAVRRVNEVFG